MANASFEYLNSVIDFIFNGLVVDVSCNSFYQETHGTNVL